MSRGTIKCTPSPSPERDAPPSSLAHTAGGKRSAAEAGLSEKARGKLPEGARTPLDAKPLIAASRQEFKDCCLPETRRPMGEQQMPGS